MSGAAKTLLFILFLPFLAALSHDVYLNYFSDDQKMKQVKRLQINPDDFMFSDTGWMWNNYHPATMETARTMVEPEVWKEKVDPLLQLPSMAVALIPFFIGCAFLLLSFVLGVWPFSRQGTIRKTSEDDFAVYKHAKTKAVKFSKK